MTRLVVAASLAAAIAACDGDGAQAVTPPTTLCRSGAPEPLCRPVADVERLLAHDDLEILSAGKPPAGIQGVRVLTLRTRGARQVVFRAKWRAHATLSRRNDPRYELISYDIQKLFLDPGQYIVPPAAAHCFPLAQYRAVVDRDAKATFPGTKCVYGVLSYWLEDVQSIRDAREAGWFHGQDRHVFDPLLFERSRGYRDSVAHVNIFTILIRHADSHARNFVITENVAAPTVYSVDNSLSLGMEKNPKLSPEHDWSELRVKALPRTAIERLRTAPDRLAKLGAVAVLRPEGGQLVLTDPGPVAPAAAKLGWDGKRLTIGLTPAEIDGIRRRLTALLARVDRGEIKLY